MGNSKTRANQSIVVKQEATQRIINVAHVSAIGIDVHLDLLVCAYQASTEGEIITEVRNFGTSYSQLKSFASWCAERQPEIVLMESTGVLWQSPYAALEAHGFTSDRLALVNARDVKAAMGRKTDREDAIRLAEFARMGRVRKSFVPKPVFREMRLLARLFQKAKNDLARKSNRYQKLLNAAGCRASTVFSDVVHGKAASRILDAFLWQSPELYAIVQKESKRLKASPEEIMDALHAQVPPVLVEQLREERLAINHEADYCDRTMRRLKNLQKPYELFIKLLCTIPGIQETSARLIFAELSDDLEQHFRDSEHFASWMGLCPGNHLSAGKSYSSKTPKGNKWLRRVLTECAHGIALSRKGALWARFTAYKLRRGTKRAIIALAHKLALIIYSCMTSGECYVERETTALRDVCKNRLANAHKLYQMHGQEVRKQAVRPAISRRDTGATQVAVC